MKDIFKDLISFIFYAVSFLSPPHGDVVLVYHSVGKINPQDDFYKTNVNPELFQRQMQLVSRMKNRNITVTFDDGFAAIFEYAIPVILRYNIKTIVFVTTGFIDGKISFNHLFRGKVKPGPLSWKQIREMADSGMGIGAHTITHPNLAELDREAALKEIKESKERIEEETGRPVQYFAYPFGPKSSFNKEVKGLVRESGYERAYTNILGFNNTNSDPYELRRIRIYSNDNMLRFRMKLRGACNWVDNYVK